MLNEILNKFLPCEKVIKLLLAQHAQASEMNRNACNRLQAACNAVTGKDNVVSMQKVPSR